MAMPAGAASRRVFPNHSAAEGSTLRQFFDLVFQYCYEHSLRQECEAVIRRRIKEKADRETVRAFTRNLRSQLMSPPLGSEGILQLHLCLPEDRKLLAETRSTASRPTASGFV